MTGVLTVRQALKRLPDGACVVGAPKVDSYRVLRLPGDLVAPAAGPPSHSAQGATVIGGVGDHGLVFTNSLGGAIDRVEPAAYRGHLCRAGQRGHLSPNELRHSAASLLVADGTPLQDVSDLLGHRDIRMLAQTYRHKIRSVVDITTARSACSSGEIGSPTPRRSGQSDRSPIPAWCYPCLQEPSSHLGR